MFPVKIPYPPNSTHQLPLNWFYQYQLVVSFPCMSPGHIDTTGTQHKIKNYNAKSYSIWNPYRGIDKLSNFPGGIKRLVFQGVFSNFSDLQDDPCGVTVRRQNLIENYAGKCHAKRRTVWRTSKVVLQGAIKKFSRAGDLNLNQITGGPQKKTSKSYISFLLLLSELTFCLLAAHDISRSRIIVFVSTLSLKTLYKK